MLNIYLRIHYGCDDRFNLVSRTIRVSAPYFKEICITNFGPDKNITKFDLLLKEFSNLRIINLGKYYHMGITEDLLRHHVADVPDGDWVALLDSDWRFPPYFLEHMHEELEKCEKEGFNHLFSNQLAHYKTLPDGTYEQYTQDVINRYVDHFKKNPNAYGFPIIQKVDKKNLWIDSFFGNHTYYLHIPYNKKHVPEMYHLHMRDFSDQAYSSTMSHQAWWYLGHNEFTLEGQSEIYNSWEYNAIENFKIKHRCFTSNDYHEMKEDNVFKEKLRALFVQFKDSKIPSCTQMYRLATKYDMVYLGTNPMDLPCDGVCCNYKCGKIKDLPI